VGVEFQLAMTPEVESTDGSCSGIDESEAPAASTRTSASGWGGEDPEVRLTGVHLRVLGGHPVWPLAFHQFVMARDWRAFVEQCLVCCDFLPILFRSGSVGACLLEELLAGYHDEWGTARVPAVEADCVLAALGLLHLRVKCVIPEESGGDY
jgi:hypothetical protein